MIEINNMLSMEKRAEIFEKKLSEYDLTTLAYICKHDVESEANKIADKQMFTVNQALDTSISAALYEMTDLSIKQVEKIISKSADYMKDCEEFLIKYKEDWIMEINKIKPDIKEECLKLLDKGTTANNQAAKELKKIFPKIPPKDLVNTFQEIKEEYLENKKIIEEISEEVVKEILPQNKPITAAKEPTNNISQETKKESVEKAREGKKSIFEVVKKEIVLKGQYGTYKINDEAVFAGEIKFTCLQDIEDYKNKQLEEFEKHIKEIQEVFDYI